MSNFFIIYTKPSNSYCFWQKLGNKCDLPKEDREVSTEEGQKLSDKFKISFFETSAKTRTNIDEAYLTLAKLILKYGTADKVKPERDQKPEDEHKG